MSNLTGVVVLLFDPESLRERDGEFYNFARDYGASSTFEAAYFKKRDKAEQFTIILAGHNPGKTALICPVSDLYQSEATLPVHRKVTDKGEIVPGNVVKTPDFIAEEHVPMPDELAQTIAVWDDGNALRRDIVDAGTAPIRPRPIVPRNG